MANHNHKSAPDLPALPLPEVLLVYGEENKSRFKPEGQLFQWRFDGLERIQYVADIAAAQAVLQTLQGQPFTPVIVFDRGESSNVLKIFRHDLPDFAVIEAADEPDEAEYALCNPEASVEAIWYPLLEGEPIAEPPAIWHDPTFLAAYGEAFVQWLRRHPERHGMEPLDDLKLDDFQILKPQIQGHHRFIHRYFPLAWLDLQRVNSTWKAVPGGALDGIGADDLYVRHGKAAMVLADVPGEVWAAKLPVWSERGSAQVVPFPKQRSPILEFYVPATRAAADGKAKNTPPPHDGTELKISGTERTLPCEYTVICEDLPFDPDHQQLVFECTGAIPDKLIGNSVEIVVAGVHVKLEAVVGRRGLAKGKIPRSLDLFGGYEVHFYAPEDEPKT